MSWRKSQESLDSPSSGVLSVLSHFSVAWFLTFVRRDSEESAPQEFPPDQPEADEAEDDGDAYGAEEEEAEGVEEEAGAAAGDDDVEMGGAEDTSGPAVAAKGADEVSDDGSEDLGTESSAEEDDEEEGEGEDEEAMDAMMDDAPSKPGEGSSSAQNPPA